MRRFLTYILAFVLISLPCFGESLPEYGLYIQTYPHPSSAFSELLLDNGEAISIKNKKTDLCFSIYNRADNVFGCVFRIITNKGLNIDLMYSVDALDRRYPMLVVGDMTYTLPETVKINSWLDIDLCINPKTSTIDLKYDSFSINIKNEAIKDIQSAIIVFGNSTVENFYISDVASVNLRDIILKLDDKAIRHWKLALYHDNICYDEVAGSPAIARNPNWLINKYVSWTNIYHKEYEKSPSIAFDSTIGTFYIASDNNNIFLFYPSERREDKRKVNGGVFAATFPNQLIYIAQEHSLLSYNLDENIYSIFDNNNSIWESETTPTLDHDYWNNTINYFPEEKSLVSFGGYGHYLFNNVLLLSYPFDTTKVQEKIILEEIDPRYSAASTIIDNTLYIFGGRGNPSGHQELSPRDYYDLYSVDLKTKKVTKIWEIEQVDPGHEFHPSGNMIYDKNEDCFYTITNLHSGKLLKISRTEPKIEIMSLSLENPFSAQYIYSNLHYASGPNMLYTVIQQTQVDGSACVDIYELAFPPISVKSLEQNIPEEGKGNVGLIILLICIGLGILGFFVIKNRSIHKQKKQYKELEIVDTETLEASLTEKTFYNFNKQCICFFGGFKVMDSEGNNITYLFTPTLRTMLIMLILYSETGHTGISGSKMISLMWCDKTDDSAKNSRNVYISKLRSLVEKIGGVKIINENGVWSIKFDEGTFCDYCEVGRLYQKKDIESLCRLLELLLQGTMLPSIEIDWIDQFKSDFSNGTIDFLTSLLNQDGFSDEFRLKIASTLFQHDFINEEALNVSCRILWQQGKKSLAKAAYDRFCKEYYNMMGSEYGVKFNKITDSLS